MNVLTRLAVLLSALAVSCSFRSESISGTDRDGGGGTDPDGAVGRPDAAAGDPDGAAPCATLYGCDWAARRLLTFGPLTGGENLTDFPVMVRVDATRIDYDLTQPDGDDVRFTDMADNPLAHEIDSWNEAGSSVAWVKVPSLAAAGGGMIWMYYGNDGASDGQDPASVWSNGYRAVYHMLTVEDSTGHGFDGIDQGTSLATGLMSYGRLFEPANGDFIDTTLDEHLPMFTVECLTRGDLPDSSGANGPVMKQNNFQVMWDHGDVGYRGSLVILQGGIRHAASFGALAGDVWYYLAGTYDGDTLTAYKDGLLTGINPAPAGSPEVDAPPISAKIGRHAGNNFLPASFYGGLIDEVRISSVPRSAAWIAATAQTMNDLLVTFGAEETLTN